MAQVLEVLTISGTHKTVYMLGEAFDDEGMVVTYTHNDTNTVVTDYEGHWI